jgi:hypothetical protein
MFLNDHAILSSRMKEDSPDWPPVIFSLDLKISLTFSEAADRLEAATPWD